MTEVYMVRHAESDLSVKDDRIRPLSGKGMEDAKRLPQVFKDVMIDKIYSSPYKRTIDTLLYLSMERDRNINEIENLRERKIGEWIKDFDEYSNKQWSDFGYKLNGGESLLEVQKRNKQVIERLLVSDVEKTIVIGTHGTAMSTIMNHYDNSFGYEKFLEMVNLMPYIIKIKFKGEEFAGFSTIEF